MPNTLEDAGESLARRLLHYARPRQVQLVLRIAEAGAIQKAAAAFGMSQPAATQSLTRLEELLGITLFDRHARGVRLTRDGRLLLPALKRLHDSIEMLAHDAAHLGDCSICAAGPGLFRRSDLRLIAHSSNSASAAI